MKQNQAMRNGVLARSLALMAAALLVAAGSARGGFNDDWDYKASLTFSGYSGTETLTNFPVLVSLAGFSGFAYSQVANAAGGDLRFADADGAELNFEIESWNPSGDTFVWVQVPALTNNTTITAYWGNDAATLPVYATDGSTWSNGYVAVYHLSETSGTSGDSSPQANTLTLKGNTTLGSAGMVGLSPRLPDGINDWLEAADHGSLEGMGQLTLEAWIYDEQNDTNARAIISKRTSSSSQISFYLFKFSNRNISFFLGNSTGAGGLGGEFTGTTTDANRWYHVAATYDKDLASNRMKVFLDGVYKSARNEASGNVTATTSALRLGILNADYGNAWKGKLDEVRIANVARSSDWLAATHKTIADNAGFADYGDMVPTDLTTPVFAADPAIALSESGDGFVVSAELASGEADLFAVFGPEASFAYTNLLALGVEPGVVVSNTLSGLPADRMLSFGVLATNANGHAILRTSSTPFMSGEVAIAGTSDAFEEGFAHGAFTLTRPATATNLPLTVAYAASGSAVGGVNYAALAGTVAFPIGAATVQIDVTPLLEAGNANDTTLVLTLEPGLFFIGEEGEASITIQNWDPPAGYNVWVAPSAGNASDAANWSLGVPTATDHILLDVFSPADMTWDAGVNGLPDAVASWTQTADYTGTVTFPINFTNVVGAVFTNFVVTGNAVIDGGAWTHAAHVDSPTEMRKDYYRLRVQIGGALSIGTGGSISATAKGSFRAYNGNGGAYGGNNNYNGSVVYGDPVEPVHVGSGVLADNGQNADGGGAIWLEVAGATTLDGALAANGVTAAGQWGDIYAGSGGAIYLKAASLSGSGTISANGSGYGGSKCKDIGSGGRISILLTDAEMAFPITNVKAISGGSQYSAVGGAGTVVVRTPAMPNGMLRVVNKPGMYGMYAYRPRTLQLTAIPAGQTWNFDALVTGDNGILAIPDGTTINLPNGLESVSSSSTERENGLFLSGGSLTLPEQPTHTLSGAWILQANTPLAISGNLVVTNSAAVGTLRLYNTSTNSCTRCALSVSGDMTVAHDAYVYAINGGYASKDATTPNGSGGYGSHGGQNAQYATSTVYGSILDPDMAGTYGGSANYAPYGGGNVQLEVGGTLTVNGLATAGVATPSNGRPGGGGTLNIVAARLSGTGSIHANGNLRNYKDGDQYGASGGGRVAVRLTDSSAEFSDYWKSAINAKGRYTSASTLLAAYSSSAGTVYLQSGDEAEATGTIIVRNDNDSRNNVAFTPIPSRRHGGEADAFDKASFTIEDYARVKFYESLKAESLSMESGTVLDLAGMTLTLRSMQAGGVNVPSGTYTAGSTLFTDGYVTDSVGSGSVVVLGAGTVMVIR